MDASAGQQPLSVIALGKRRETRCDGAQISVLVHIPTSLAKHHHSRRRKNDATGPCALVGWSIPASCSDNVGLIVVAGIAPSSLKLGGDVIDRFTYLGHRPRIVGHLMGQGDQHETKQTVMNGHKSDDYSDTAPPLLLRCTASGSTIVGLSLALPGASRDCAVHLIEYIVPDPGQMRFYSLEAMVLPLASQAHVGGAMYDHAGIEKPARRSSERLQSKLGHLVRLDPVRFEDLGRKYPAGEAPGERLRTSILLLNRSQYLTEALSSTHCGRDDRGSSNAETHRVARYAAFALGAPLKLFRTCVRSSVAGQSMLTSSLLVQQLDVRCGQFLAWPALGVHLRSQRLKEQASVSDIAPAYTSLYNGIWLVGNDLILGRAVGAWLLDNHERIAAYMGPRLQEWLSDAPIQALAWLDSWPAGIKLNSQLSRFFRDIFTIIAKVCGDGMVTILTQNDSVNLIHLLYGISMTTQWLGLSIFLALIIDIVRAAALPLTVCYNTQRRIFVFFCSSLRSLFQLFRGKKRNPLRKMRVDDADYELDQLLLGTLFFTLFAFLWLTVGVYYAYFAAIRLAVVTTVILLQTAITMLNHLPLFALMLRFKDPRRLPGGISFRSLETPGDIGIPNNLASTHYRLESVPLSVSDIFRGYYSHLDGLKSLPRRILQALQGQHI